MLNPIQNLFFSAHFATSHSTIWAYFSDTSVFIPERLVWPLAPYFEHLLKITTLCYSRNHANVQSVERALLSKGMLPNTWRLIRLNICAGIETPLKSNINFPFSLHSILNFNIQALQVSSFWLYKELHSEGQSVYSHVKLARQCSLGRFPSEFG